MMTREDFKKKYFDISTIINPAIHEALIDTAYLNYKLGFMHGMLEAK